jgi:hypothetical protein
MAIGATIERFDSLLHAMTVGQPPEALLLRVVRVLRV